MTTKAHMAVLALLSVSVSAWAGQLKPVACDPGLALSARPISAARSAFQKHQGEGLVSDQAMVGTIKRSGFTFLVAIDASSTKAKAPDVVRFDFTGKGQFAGAPTAPLKAVKAPGNLYRATFGPIQAMATVNGQTVPVKVEGTYMKAGAFRQLSLHVGTAAEGKCDFGGKTYAVRIIDGNGNLQPGNPWQRRAFGKAVAVVPGDTVQIDLGDGTFTKAVRTACYGSPVEIGGKWYNVTVSADGKSVSASQVNLVGGKLLIDHPKWKAMLVGDKYVLPIEAGPEPISIPAGTYTVRSFEEFSAPNAEGKRAHLTIYPSPMAKSSKLTVEADKTTEFAIGSPLKGAAKAAKRGSQVILSLALTDVAGRRVISITNYKGQKPPKPDVTVTDAAGKSVYKNTLEYG